ncbi:FcoT-like thioesterase domain-containing protein [Micromonospora pattaloongensis]|uniref:(2E)-enoyl-[ACP] glycyltransferase n=1 Tax=Micromonospora pattaloongensis TaxID=405436 RepID=A0A1H3PBY1_9ACTN|nr:FcoT family thioesterase [Micromonospora pattaloongensis]SDY98315.1 FcoT-like thioesterase domain-containing protein [Micromonospora pattaloongensis]
MPAPEEEHALRFGEDAELLDRVLRPYREHCKYLKSAVVTASTDPDTAPLTARCEFEIPESCYIDDTGHFNAVEFNICYNQMFYYVAAKAVLEKAAEPYAQWTMDDYWRRQLPNILITDFRSSFRRAMHGKRFYGEISFTRIHQRGSLLINDTRCRYWDDGTGDCRGEVKVVITDAPAVG